MELSWLISRNRRSRRVRQKSCVWHDPRHAESATAITATHGLCVCRRQPGPGPQRQPQSRRLRPATRDVGEVRRGERRRDADLRTRRPIRRLPRGERLLRLLPRVFR
jgi:hypothetical protein